MKSFFKYSCCLIFFLLDCLSVLFCANYPADTSTLGYQDTFVRLTSIGVGDGDWIKGFAWFSQGFDIDISPISQNTDIYWYNIFPVGVSIAFRPDTSNQTYLHLDSDLRLSANFSFTTNGRLTFDNSIIEPAIVLDGNTRIEDVTLVLYTRPYFQGNGNTLDFCSSGQLSVELDKTMSISNTILVNAGSGTPFYANVRAQIHLFNCAAIDGLDLGSLNGIHFFWNSILPINKLITASNNINFHLQSDLNLGPNFSINSANFINFDENVAINLSGYTRLNNQHNWLYMKKGEGAINGNGNVFDFVSSSGQIWVEADKTLTVSNMILENFGYHSFYFPSSTGSSRLIFSDLVIKMISNWNFINSTACSLSIYNLVAIQGPYYLVHTHDSSHGWTIFPNSTLYFDRGSGYMNNAVSNVPFENIENASKIYILGSELNMDNAVVNFMIFGAKNRKNIPVELITANSESSMKHKVDKVFEIIGR